MKDLLAHQTHEAPRLLLRNPASSGLSRSRQDSITSPMRRLLSFGMCGVRFNRGESGLLAADRTPVFDTVLKAYVTSFPPAEGDDGSP